MVIKWYLWVKCLTTTLLLFVHLFLSLSFADCIHFFSSILLVFPWLTGHLLNVSPPVEHSCCACTQHKGTPDSQRTFCMQLVTTSVDTLDSWRKFLHTWRSYHIISWWKTIHYRCKICYHNIVIAVLIRFHNILKQNGQFKVFSAVLQ